MNTTQLVATGTLHDLFEMQADLNPSQVALKCGSTELTYMDLDCRSSQLAQYLHAKGIRRGCLVGICMQRSQKPIIALLGILKSGAGYVPIDPEFPPERIRHIVEDANPAAIITEDALNDRISGLYSGDIINWEHEYQSICSQLPVRLFPSESHISPNDICYIIYTSGTTGRPKGVVTRHRNAKSFVESFNEVCRLSMNDRVYQGFSLGFDGSVEEMWMAFSNGATLVVGTPDIVKIASEVSCLINRERVTFFSTVPTFLAMIEVLLPTVRLLIVSGEQCTQELADKWATPNRRMLNVYGPTETTVNTTAAECRSGKPVTIGRPLSGYDLFLLNEHLEPVADGQEGELYIGGVGVAGGYLNQLETTQKHFISNPFNGHGTSSRLYRTGDLVKWNSDGELVFLGRIDSQVKIRGYRIELSEIEAILRECEQVHSAAVTVNERGGRKDLAAFIVPAENDEPLNRDVILGRLRDRFPSYMIPSYLDTIEKMPRLTSGKIDRKRLPLPRTPLTQEKTAIVAPSSKLEKKLHMVWKNIFSIDKISVDDDFFTDLGGYSLMAAQLVSFLRRDAGLTVTVRDVYTYPTIKKLAEHLENGIKSNIKRDREHTAPKRQLSSEVFNRMSRLTRWCCVGFQTLSLYLLYGLGTAPIMISLVLYLGLQKGTISIGRVGTVSAGLFFGMYPAMLGLSIAAKWIIIGKYRPGEYPVWGWYYFRWWLVERFTSISGASFLAGTPLMGIYYRLMGAKVGMNCTINTAQCSIFDQVSIGDETSIGFETQLLGYRVDDGLLKIGKISIGKRCFVGIQSALGLNTIMGDDALLDDLSLLKDGDFMEQGESRRGSPSHRENVAVPATEQKQPGRIGRFLFGCGSVILMYAVELFLLVAAVPSFYLVHLAYHTNDTTVWIMILLGSIPLFELTYWALLIGIKAVMLRKVKPGTYPVGGMLYMRKWFIDSLITLSRLVTLPLYTTLYILPLLRMLGAKIGKRAELSVIAHISPELVVLEDESFFADGSIIGGIRLYRGSFEMAVNRIGKRSFIGNSALLPTGTSVGDNCLLGVLSTPRNRSIPDTTEWLGSPCFQLPHRKKVEGFGEQVTYKPSAGLYAARLCIDALRIALCSSIEIAGFIALMALLYFSVNYLSPVLQIVSLPIFGFGAAAFMALSVIVAKNVLMGTYKPTIKPLWSPYVWLNEVINGAYESVASPLMSLLLGTPFYPVFMRLLGCNIGRNCFVDTTLFGEFDLVNIGDNVALNKDVVIQNHLFEDRIFKSSHVTIRNNSSVGNLSVILYDTTMEEGANIGSLSLLMKGESVPSNSCWLGTPITCTTAESVNRGVEHAG